MQSWSMTRQGSCERGSCSACCRFGCCSDLVPKVALAETSCCVDSICSKKVIGTDSMQKQPKSPYICPASELSPPSRGPRHLARKSEWGKFREQGSVSQVQRWLQERRKRCKNSNTEGLKCNSVPSQRRFLSMNRNQCLWTGASSWQACGHPEDLPQGREGAHMNTSRSCWMTRTPLSCWCLPVKGWRRARF